MPSEIYLGLKVGLGFYCFDKGLGCRKPLAVGFGQQRTRATFKQDRLVDDERVKGLV